MAPLWEPCSPHHRYNSPYGECSVYRYHQLLKDKPMLNRRCEALTISQALIHLDIHTGTEDNDLKQLKKDWKNHTGRRWNGDPIPDQLRSTILRAQYERLQSL